MSDHVRRLASELNIELERQKPHLDDGDRRALQDLHDRIEARLDNEAEQSGDPAPSDEARSFIDRLERDHPDLTAVISRIADALANIGM